MSRTTIVRIPALADGRASIKLVRAVPPYAPVLGFEGIEWATHAEILDLSSPADIPLTPTGDIALAGGGATAYEVRVSKPGGFLEIFRIGVPVSTEIVDLRDRVGAEAIDPAALPAQIVADTQSASATAIAAAETATEQAGLATTAAGLAAESALAASRAKDLTAAAASAAVLSASHAEEDAIAADLAKDAAEGFADDAAQSASDIAGMDATVDGSGNLILTIGTQGPINAGHVKGADGATHDLVTLTTKAAELLSLTGQSIGLQPVAAGMVLCGPLSGDPAAPTFREFTGGAALWIDDTAPTDPAYQFWWIPPSDDPGSGHLYIRYSGAWVDANGNPGQPTHAVLTAARHVSARFHGAM